MLYIGLAFLIDWLLQQVFTVDEIKATLITALIFIVLGILTDEIPAIKNWNKS